MDDVRIADGDIDEIALGITDDETEKINEELRIRIAKLSPKENDMIMLFLPEDLSSAAKVQIQRALGPLMEDLKFKIPMTSRR